MVRKTIKNAIAQALDDLNIEIPEHPTGEAGIELEHPADLVHGDYASNIALVLGQKMDRNPRELADEIVEEISGNLPDDIKEVEVAGPGFINFHLSRTFFTDTLENIFELRDQYGSSVVGNNKTVVVEYSSPNIAKPFTVGHLRGTIIGDCIANLLMFSGYSVVRDNHLGDWGTQFGKTLFALDAWGDISEIEDSDEPVKALVDLYVRFHKEAEANDELNDRAREWFAKLEDNDPDAVALWEKVKTWSFNAFEDIYARLGVKFDTTHGESKFSPLSAEVMKDLEAKNLLTESEGAKLVFFTAPSSEELSSTDQDEAGEEIMPPLMIQKSDGTTLYATRDLATDKWRKEEYGADISVITEAGTEQTLYFRQLFEVEELLGYFSKNQRTHVAHGLFRFADKKMSTREGNVIWLEDILDEAVEQASEFNDTKEVAETVAIGAIKYNDLKRDLKKDIVFDWEEVLSLEGNSGPYLQYTYARAKSVLRKAEQLGLESGTQNVPKDTTDIEKLLYRFPEVVERATSEHAPHYVATHIHDLAKAFNTFYGNTKIIEKDESATSYRLALTAAVAQVISNGLRLLGIETIEEM